MGSLINRFRRDDEGAALVEYGNACGPDRRNLRGGRHKSRDRNKHSFQQHRERPFRNLTSSGVARLPSRAAAGCPLNELAGGACHSSARGDRRQPHGSFLTRRWRRQSRANPSLNAEFPASREFTGNFIDSGPPARQQQPKKGIKSERYEPIPYASEQGIFCSLAGNLNR